MNKVDPQSFTPDRWTARLVYCAFWVFSLLTVSLIGFAIHTYIREPANTGDVAVSLGFALFFSAFAALGICAVLQLRRAPVSIDEDGIWYSGVGKAEGLMRWEDIASFKEHHYNQRLELCSEDGTSVIKLEFQLDGFERLRDIVLANAHRQAAEIKFPVIFKKSAFYHVFNLSFLVAFTALSIFVGLTHAWLGFLALAVVVGLGSNEYLNIVSMLTINDRTIDVRYPLRVKSLSVAEVEDIELSDRFVKNNRIPQVLIASRTLDKPIQLSRLGVGAIALHEILCRWKQSASQDS